MKRQVKCFINGRYSRTWVERSQVIAGGGPLLWPHKKKVYTEIYGTNKMIFNLTGDAIAGDAKEIYI